VINRRRFINSLALTPVLSATPSFAAIATNKDEYWNVATRKDFAANYPKTIKIENAFGFDGLTVSGTRDEYNLDNNNPGNTRVGYNMRYQRTRKKAGKPNKTADANMFTLTLCFPKSNASIYVLHVGSNTAGFIDSRRHVQSKLPAVGATNIFPLQTKSYGLRFTGQYDEHRRLSTLVHCGFWTAWIPYAVYTIPKFIDVKPGSIASFAGLASSYLMTKTFLGRIDSTRPYIRMTMIYCWDAIEKRWVSFVIDATKPAAARLLNAIDGSESRIKNAVGQLYSDIVSVAGIGGILAGAYHVITSLTYLSDADYENESANMPIYMSCALAVGALGSWTMAVSEKVSTIRKNTAACAQQMSAHLADQAVKDALIGTVKYLSAKGADLFGIEASYPDEAPPNVDELSTAELGLLERVDELRSYGVE
jgi:hypothetical protein